MCFLSTFSHEKEPSDPGSLPKCPYAADFSYIYISNNIDVSGNLDISNNISSNTIYSISGEISFFKSSNYTLSSDDRIKHNEKKTIYFL